MTRGYQYDYSRGNESMHSVLGRQQKAATMLAVLSEAMGVSRLALADVLNLGCSTGLIDEFLASHVKTMTGVDIDAPAVELASRRSAAENTVFQVDDAVALSFPDASFDVVICSQVYEHVPDAKLMVKQIYRVLRPGGVCYFAATNRWAIIERHYKLPFLSWLPARVADAYVRMARRGDAYYERHLGYYGLKSLVRDFAIEDYTARILADPQHYGASYMLGSFRARVASKVHQVLPVAFPGFIWLLWKRPSVPSLDAPGQA